MEAMRSLLDPKAVAVVGASQRRGRGTNVIANLRDCGFAGEIFAVNPRYQDVLGYKCFPTVSDLPASVDCLAVAVAADATCSTKRTRAASPRPSSLHRASGKVGTGMPVPRGCGRSRSKGCASAGQT